MGKWIDADALIAKMPTVMDMQDAYLPIHFKEWLIDTAPSIDIVFCKECTHGTYCEEAEMYICSANDQDLYEAEHFCSYGEREGE